MKTTTFYTTTKKSNNSKNNFRSTGLTDYSKILDALITGNVKAKNPYLFMVILRRSLLRLILL